MAQFLQSFAHGYIARDGDKYQYVVNEKVVGSYDTVDALVKAQNGNKADEAQPAAAEAGVAKTRSRKAAKSSK